MFAVFILTVGALMLSAALSSSERMNSIARERAIANNILRAYIERIRQQYPTSSGSTDMTKLRAHIVMTASGGTAGTNYTDGSATPDATPIYDLSILYSTGLVEKGVLKNATATVYICEDEFGLNWGPCATASITAPTTISAATVTSAMTTADKTSLGLPRDLNADGIPCGTATTATGGSGTYNALTDVYGASGANNTTKSIVLVPMKVELSWISGNAIAIGANQKLTIYALFSPQH
jgi:hypothetical protein